MPRPATSGKYIVPAEIKMLKPKDIPCTVKAIEAPSKTIGARTHYYVYELLSVPDAKHPGKKKNNSGPCIGKIEGGSFCPNKKGIKRLYGARGDDTAGQSGDGAPDGADAGQDTTKADGAEPVPEAVANMNLGLDEIDLQVKDYGEYAVVLASTGRVLQQLNRHFSTDDSRLLYALGVIYFVEEYTPASYVHDVFEQSVLSNKWPSLAISENTVNEFLKLVGRHPVVCEEYSQDLIDSGSGLTAIDGHVILSCSKRNGLADYGNKYRKLGNKQVNILEAYDVVNEVPLTSKAYEGGLPDKSSVQELFVAYTFPPKTVFLVDMGFYSEDNLGLFREGGKHFVIPVPESTSISWAIRPADPYEGSFVYEKFDEDGIARQDRILYRETSVSELEDVYQEMVDSEADWKNVEESLAHRDGEKPKKHYSRKVKRSAYGGDRVIIFRDEDMHEKMVREFLSQIGSDDAHTEEKLAELGPGFGVIVLRTNLAKGKAKSPSEIYCKYKKRWKIETHYNYVENIVKFCGLKTEDYYSMQGLSFLIQIVGQIKSEYMKRLRSSASSYVKHLSIKESLVKASHLKLSQHKDRKWHISVTTKKIVELMSHMGVSIEDDIKKLNSSTY